MTATLAPTSNRYGRTYRHVDCPRCDGSGVRSVTGLGEFACTHCHRDSAGIPQGYCLKALEVAGFVPVETGCRCGGEIAYTAEAWLDVFTCQSCGDRRISSIGD